MKKTFCFLFVVCSGGVVAEPSAVKSISPTTSPYRLGFGLAAELLSSEAKLKLQPSGTLGNISSTQQHSTKKFQVAPSVEFGRFIADDYYLGVQFSWRRSRARSTSSSSMMGYSYAFSHEFKMKSYSDIFLKVGYKPSPQFMVYGLAGPSVARWHYTMNQLLLDNTLSVQSGTPINQIKMKETSVGLGLGIGTEFRIKEKVSISLEYTHHMHRSKKHSDYVSYDTPVTVLTGGGPITRYKNSAGNLKTSVQPSYSTIALRVTFFVSPF